MAIQDRYALLRRVVRIANSHDLPYFSRLRSLVRLFAKKLPAESVTIYLLDEDRRHLSRYISSVGSGRPSPCYIPIGEGVAGMAAAVHAPMLLNRKKLHASEISCGNETLFLALPLLDCGIISFGHSSASQPRLPNDGFVDDLLVSVEGLLQRINLAEGSARRVRNLMRVGEIGHLLNRPLPPRQMIDLILEGCIKNSDACCVVLRLLEEKGLPGGVYKRCRGTGKGQQLAQIIACEESVWPSVVENGVPLLACDLIAEGDFPRSYVSVPLQFKTKVIGALTFFGKKGNRGYCRNFNGEDRDTFENIGRLIANGIAETVNYEKLVVVSRKNDKKVRELSLLHNISNAMLSTIRLNRLIHLTLTTLVAGTNSFFERAMLFLINERAGVMQGMFGISRDDVGGYAVPLNPSSLESQRGIEAEMHRHQESEFCRKVMATRLEMNDPRNICSRAVQGRRVILVSDSLREKRLDQDFVRRFDLSSFAIAPLMAKEQVVGVVIVDNPLQARPISEEDLHFLQLFTNQAGMAIENSMLYSRLEEANRSLCDARERLVHSARLATIGEMSATIAHELKGPLVAIGGFARRLEKKIPATSSESTSVATIIREVQRLEKMLTDILSYAKKTTICYTSCCITEIIEDALAIVTPALDDKEISIRKNFPRKHITFLGDAQQLKQVFINLFLNSQEAMSRRGTIEIAVMPAKMDGTPAVSVSVADSGGGIPQHVINQIFTPFYTTKDSGTGLGLPIANRIITNHGGNIQVKNRGGGAEFNIILPLVG